MTWHGYAACGEGREEALTWGSKSFGGCPRGEVNPGVGGCRQVSCSRAAFHALNATEQAWRRRTRRQRAKPAAGWPVCLGAGLKMRWATSGAFFIFIFFISIFYKNIFSIWKFTEVYPARPAAGRQGLERKKKEEKKLQTGPWGRSPGSGAAGPPGRPI